MKAKVFGQAMGACLAVMALGWSVLWAQQPAPPDLPQKLPRPQEAVSKSFFLGVQCEPAPQYVKKHVLNTDYGLLVRDVMPNSPAAKAGIQQGAILLQANGKPLATPAALQQAVQQSKGKPMKLLLWQQGKKQELLVQPKQLDWRRFPRTATSLPQFPAFPPVWFMPPGMDFFPGTKGQPKIPDDVSIRIEKPAGKPAQVRVQRGKEVWVAPLDQLHKLPPEPRRWIRRLLGTALSWPFEPMPMEQWEVPPFPPSAMPPEFQQQLQQMNRRLQQLHKRLQQLEQRLQQPREE